MSNFTRYTKGELTRILRRRCQSHCKDREEITIFLENIFNFN